MKPKTQNKDQSEISVTTSQKLLDAAKKVKQIREQQTDIEQKLREANKNYHNILANAREVQNSVKFSKILKGKGIDSHINLLTASVDGWGDVVIEILGKQIGLTDTRTVRDWLISLELGDNQ